ncbi:MAG: integrase core domain-containing protein [Pirellulales bacterium]
MPAKRLLGWLELSTSKFHQWKDRYGRANEHNGQVPRDWWLEDWEKQAILDYHERHPLEGYSRYIVHWELRETMKEREVETIVQRGLENFPGVTPRIISDNGPQFIARDFKSFVRIQGLTHVRTSPYYPQSNGKLERWHASLKQECIRPKCPASLDEARAQVQGYVDHHNHERLHSAIEYLTPADKLNGMGPMILEQRDQKLEEARARRQQNRAAAKAVA